MSILAQASIVKPEDLSEIDLNAQETLKKQADQLIVRLKKCKKGKENSAWKEFELVCCDILDFSIGQCFNPYNPKKQATSWDKHQRVDILVPNHPYDRKNTFWQDIKNGRKTDNIVFECKNYSSGLKKEEVLQAKNYEWKSTGKFRVILSRDGLSEEGKIAVRHWFQYADFLILTFDQDSLINLINSRVIGQDPEVIFCNLQDDDQLFR